MVKIQTLIMLLLLATQSIGQITLFSDDLEAGSGSWTFTGDLLPNFWISNSCAGNGIASPGTNAMYITPGGSLPGCGATGTEQYAYENSPLGSLSAISYATIDGGCVTTMQITFDYKIEGTALEDYAELVYSDNNGASWNTIGLSLPVSAIWTTTTISLPALLEGTIFDLGFRFTYNDNGIAGSPLALDNITIQGNDLVAPTIICPTNISTCDPVVTYSDPIFSDNCFAYLTQTDVTGLSSGSTFPIGITTLEYTATDSSGNSQSCSFTIEVLDFPSSANIVDDTLTVCGILSVILNADTITSGSGLWTVLSGSGDFNNQFSNTTGVNNLEYGTNVFEWTVSSASCGTLSDSIVVIATQAPSQANISQDTLLSCAISLIDLTASTPLAGSGLWTTNSTATVLNPNSSITNGQVYESGWNQFIWTVSNGSCPVSSDTLFVFSSLTPTISIPDTSICQGDGTFFLEGSVPVAEQSSEWYVMSGEGILATPQNFSTEVSSLSFGINKFRYSMASDGCPDAFIIVQINVVLCDNFDPVFPTLITPNYDGKNDLFVINGLEKIYPDCHVLIFNRWGSVVFESTGYADPWDGTFKGEDLPMGTYFYKIDLNDETGTIYNGDISIIH